MDFTPFYITITICAVLILTIFLVNIFFGCCSRYSVYWNDRNTGNLFILPLWKATPRKQPQPPLDFAELKNIVVPSQQQQLLTYSTTPGAISGAQETGKPYLK